MKNMEQPRCLDDLDCLRDCPELRPALAMGDFIPNGFPISQPDPERKVEEVARYSFPNSREAYVFNVQHCLEGGRWYAWGDYCPYGRKVTDACYQFLDGGGSFNSRSAVVWAIHAYVAHLAAGDTLAFTPNDYVFAP